MYSLKNYSFVKENVLCFLQVRELTGTLRFIHEEKHTVLCSALRTVIAMVLVWLLVKCFVVYNN